MQKSENDSKQMPEEITADLQTKSPLSHAISGSCDHSGGVITSECGDLKLTIPKGAIKDGDVVSFSVASDLYGPFVLPSKNKDDLVSPYYWISVSGSYHFHKPVQVQFEHYTVVNACDPSHYQLLTCEDDDESHTMQPVDHELDFTVQGNISLCTFETYEFCSYCLYHGCKDPVINRIAAIFLKNKDFQYSHHFTAEIWFTLPISHCIHRIKELYSEQDMILDMKCSYNFEASCDKSSKDYFTLLYDANISDWNLSHSRSAEIETKCINFHNYYTDAKELRANELISLFPPHFIVNVTQKPNCNTELHTDITVILNKAEGKSKQISFYLFVQNSAETNIIQRKPSTSIIEHDCGENEPDLKELVKYSNKIADHWKIIALNLKGCEHRIAIIDKDNNNVELKCFEMFNTWLQSDISPCWCHFIQALQTTGLHKAAEEITLKYLKH